MENSPGVSTCRPIAMTVPPATMSELNCAISQFSTWKLAGQRDVTTSGAEMENSKSGRVTSCPLSKEQ